MKAVKKFHDKQGLNFTLLADEDHAVCDLYGVWGEKSMYGKKFWGAQRATFVIDPDGTVAHRDPEGVAEDARRGRAGGAGGARGGLEGVGHRCSGYIAEEVNWDVSRWCGLVFAVFYVGSFYWLPDVRLDGRRPQFEDLSIDEAFACGASASGSRLCPTRRRRRDPTAWRPNSLPSSEITAFESPARLLGARPATPSRQR